MEEERILVVCGIIKNMLYLFTGRYRIKSGGMCWKNYEEAEKDGNFPH